MHSSSSYIMPFFYYIPISGNAIEIRILVAILTVSLASTFNLNSNTIQYREVCKYHQMIKLCSAFISRKRKNKETFLRRSVLSVTWETFQFTRSPIFTWNRKTFREIPNINWSLLFHIKFRFLPMIWTLIAVLLGVVFYF